MKKMNPPIEVGKHHAIQLSVKKFHGDLRMACAETDKDLRYPEGTMRKYFGLDDEGKPIEKVRSRPKPQPQVTPNLERDWVVRHERRQDDLADGLF